MNRRGMTLVEMLVATAATLMLMGAIAQIFAVFGTAVSDSRSVIELDGRLRAAAWRLRGDLDGATASMLPPQRPDANEGYFEIIEGANTDNRLLYDPATENAYGFGPGYSKATTAPGPTAASDDRILGDTDDVLLFTTQNNDQPFLGRFNSTSRFESPLAEVAWFLRPTRAGTTIATTNPTTYTLYRRQLLVIGYTGAPPFLKTTAADQNRVDTQLNGGQYSTWTKFYDAFDLSVRGSAYSGGMAYLPNTLADLTRPESRFMHNRTGVITTKTPIPGGPMTPYGFINPLPVRTQHQSLVPVDGLLFDSGNGSKRVGEDVVLTNVIGFDVRVFDPTAPVVVRPTDAALVPGDIEFQPGSTAPADALGCYVDLGNQVKCAVVGGTPFTPRFATLGQVGWRVFQNAGDTCWWDTWSTHYESNGVDEDGVQTDFGIDQGTNGFDDDGDGLVDEPPTASNGNGAPTDEEAASGELETTPPYPYPLRGIEVRIRCYEPSSRQVRQMTIRHTFVR
jgi:hypothetical protein